jgi:hypothetical protein
MTSEGNFGAIALGLSPRARRGQPNPSARIVMKILDLATTMKLGVSFAASVILLAASGSEAQTTQSIDMTTLNPAYLSNSTGYVNAEIGPGYSQHATTNQLKITGSDLSVESNSFAVSPTAITGDFTATVQSFVTNLGGTNFLLDTPGGYTELGTYSSGGLLSTNFNYGFSGTQVTIDGPTAAPQQITEQLSRSAMS